jgi:hypothetical protein
MDIRADIATFPRAEHIAAIIEHYACLFYFICHSLYSNGILFLEAFFTIYLLTAHLARQGNAHFTFT